MNIVIPMAGEGSRFAQKGYRLPKPFIDVEGDWMVARVLENLSVEGARTILLVRQEHLERYEAYFEGLQERFDVSYVPIRALTHGAACTVAAAHRWLNNSDELVIANVDQLIDGDFEAFIRDARERGLDGSMLTFASDESKWSYAEVDDAGLVTRVREKEVISTHATVGIYYFAKGKLFVSGLLDMLGQRDTVNGEYYVCPIYNHLIQDGCRVGIFELAPGAMHGIGTPEDLERYLQRGES